jgi:hypothetical protein
MVKIMHRRVSLSLDKGIVSQAKKLAGLVPFSRYVECLLTREIERSNAEPKKLEEQS